MKNYYDINFKLDDIRDSYEFNKSCQDTVPQALEAFFESNSFEDAIRNAISIGGDSDTLAAITGGIAEAYYGIPADIRKLQKLFRLRKIFHQKTAQKRVRRHSQNYSMKFRIQELQSL